jgi:preprotein translocase subunit SecE
VARDRKRAKQRRQRGAGADARRAARGAAGTTGGDGASNGAPAVSSEEPVDVQPARDTPDSLAGDDFAGALAKGVRGTREFDAALLRGAGGAPLISGEDEREFEAEAEDALQEPAGGSGGGGPVGGGVRVGVEERPSGAPLRGGNRAIGFLRASWAELQRVQWPDRRQVFQATAVVIGFVAIAGAYLGIADTVAKEIVEIVL